MKNKELSLREIVKKYKETCIINYAKWKDNRIVEEAIRLDRETENQALSSIEAYYKKRRLSKEEVYQIVLSWYRKYCNTARLKPLATAIFQEQEKNGNNLFKNGRNYGKVQEENERG